MVKERMDASEKQADDMKLKADDVKLEQAKKVAEKVVEENMASKLMLLEDLDDFVFDLY